MSQETAKKAVDLLFTMWDEDNPEALINQNSKQILFEFIGGEPLLDYKLMDYICSYFLETCIKKNHYWMDHWKGLFISNGLLYFDPGVQEFLKKWKNFIHPAISLDGPKEVHDINRITKGNQPTFDKSYAAYKDLKEHYKDYYLPQWITKAVINKNNISKVYDTFLFFVDDGIRRINMQFDLEEKWDLEDARILYPQLKKCADMMIRNPKLDFSLLGKLLLPRQMTMDTPCGCNFRRKLAFSWDGSITPCLRFYGTSLEEPYIVGNVDSGINYKHPIFETMYPTTMYSPECQQCPINANCFTCIAASYKTTGQMVKDRYICDIYKVSAIVSYYLYNSCHRKNYKKMPLDDDEIIRLISQEEFNELREQKLI